MKEEANVKISADSSSEAASKDKDEKADTELMDMLSSEQEFLVDNCPMALKLVQTEIDRIKSGAKPKEAEAKSKPQPDSTKEKQTLDNLDSQVKLIRRIRIPQEKYPGVNFIGRIVGPKGSEVRRLQAETGAFISIQGRGSTMSKNKDKRKANPNKLDDFEGDLHVKIETTGPMPLAYTKMGRALEHIRAYIYPEPDDEISLRQRNPDFGGGPGPGDGRGFREGDGRRGGRGNGPMFGRGNDKYGTASGGTPSPWLEGAAPGAVGGGGYGQQGNFGNGNPYGQSFGNESNYGVPASHNGPGGGRVIDYAHGDDGYVSRSGAGGGRPPLHEGPPFQGGGGFGGGGGFERRGGFDRRGGGRGFQRGGFRQRPY